MKRIVFVLTLLTLISMLSFVSCVNTGSDNKGEENKTEDTPSPEELAALSFNNAWHGFVKLSDILPDNNNNELVAPEQFGLTITQQNQTTHYVYDKNIFYVYGNLDGSDFLSITKQYDEGSVIISTSNGNTSVSLTNEKPTEKDKSAENLTCKNLDGMTANDLTADENENVYTVSNEYVKKIFSSLDGVGAFYDFLYISDMDIDLLRFSINMKSFKSKGEVGIRISDAKTDKSYVYTVVKLGSEGKIEGLSVSTFVEKGKFNANLTFDSDRIATGNIKYSSPGSNRATEVEFKIPENEIERTANLDYSECSDITLKITVLEDEIELSEIKITAAKKSNGLYSGKCMARLSGDLLSGYAGDGLSGLDSIIDFSAAQLNLDFCFDLTIDAKENVETCILDGELTFDENVVSVNVKADTSAVYTVGERFFEINIQNNETVLSVSLETTEYSDGVGVYSGVISLFSNGEKDEYSIVIENGDYAIPTLSEAEQLYLDRAEKYFINFDYHQREIAEINENAVSFVVSNFDPDIYITYDSKYGLAYVTAFSSSYVYTQCVIDFESYEYFAAKHSGRFRDYTNSPFLNEVEKYIDVSKDWTVPDGFSEQYGYGSGDYYIAFLLEGYDGYCIVHPYSYPKSAVITSQNPDGKLHNEKIVHLIRFDANGNVILHDFSITNENYDGTISKECACGKIINTIE